MDEAERLSFIAHSKLSAFKRKVDVSLRIIASALSKMKLPYVAYSGGKDSEVVLHLVRRLTAVEALTGFDDWLYPETIEKLNSTESITLIAATIWHSAFYTSWRHGPVDLPANAVWFEAVKNSRVAPYAKQQGFDGCFLGLRKEEASYRKLHLNQRGKLFFCNTHQMLECNPIADWTTMDVWAYLISKKVEYNKAYDVMSRLGIALEHQRVGPLAVDSVLGYGQLQVFKRGWPDLWSQFVVEFPEASVYV